MGCARERDCREREKRGERGRGKRGLLPPSVHGLAQPCHGPSLAAWPGGNASRWRSAQARGGRQSPQGGGEGEGCSIYVGGDDDVGLRKLEGEKEGGGCCGGVGGDLGG